MSTIAEAVNVNGTLPANCEVLEGLVDTNYLMRMFNRSDLTIIKWRQEHGLPYVQISGEGRPAVRYRLDRVRRWARSQGRKVVSDPLADAELRTMERNKVERPTFNAGNVSAAATATTAA
jgi:hypothetical protein